MKSKEEYWERLLKGYERSGLSQEEFCSEQGIPVVKFRYQWCKKFGTRSCKPIHFEPVLVSNNDSVHLVPAKSKSIEKAQRIRVVMV